MSFDKTFSIALATLGCLAVATIGMAQDLTPTTTRGTVKVQSRLFNPFGVNQSRLSIDPFGFFTVQKSSTPSVPLPLVTSPEKVQAVAAPTVVAPAASNTTANATAAPPADIATSTAVLDPTEVIAVGAARPPFRPPVRSPFRPPPRPPF
jgi:hypothetical protein